MLYGDRNNWFAAYTYWYLKYYGHDNVKLMNGPREKWISEGRPTNSRGAAATRPQQFTAQRGRRGDPREARRGAGGAGLLDTRLVDVRSPQEFSGELIAMAGYEQEGAQRSGPHPGRGLGAVGPGGQGGRDVQVGRRAARALRLEGRASNGGDPIIAYCRIGERSAHTWFVLHELLGRDDVKNYDGSWTEWGNLVAVPIEKDV